MRGILLAIALCGTAAGGLMLAPAQVIRPEPGQWVFEARVERLSTTGLPPGVSRAQLREALFGETLRAARPNCLTAEQAARALDPDHLRIEGFSREQCRTTISERSGETIRIAGSCSDARGNERDFTIAGILGARQIDLLTNYRDRSAAHGARIESELRLSGRRTGPCDENAVVAQPARQGGSSRALPATAVSNGREGGVEAANMAATDAGTR
jgi:hypothetical protein